MKTSSKHAATKWMIGALACTALLAVPQMAKADHDLFAYTGQTYGFHGEGSIIRALSALDRAYSGGFHTRVALRRASEHTRQAYELVCHPRARTYLRGALQHMRAFRHTRDLRELDDAARLLNRALVVEQRKHDFHHVRVAPPVVVGPRPFIGGYYRPVRGRDSYWGPRYPRRQISFGSRRGGFNISF